VIRAVNSAFLNRIDEVLRFTALSDEGLLKRIEDPLSEALIQGNLRRPPDCEVSLGKTGIFCRLIQPEGEVAVGAGAEADEAHPAAISLHPF
jgi:hypothetical protein